MFSKEKLRIRLHTMLRNILMHTLLWFGSFEFFVFLTTENKIFFEYLNFLRTENLHVAIFIISLLVSILFSVIDSLFLSRIWRIFPRHLVAFLKSVFYFASAFILILISARLPVSIYRERNYAEILRQLPELDINFFKFLIFFYISAFLISFLREVVKRIGRKNFRNWVFGLLNKPMEQERIFMFIDMKKSTTIAEQLGHKKFSHLVQDVFNDMAIVDNYHGEIYQYLGDGVIISWNIKDGLRRNNFIKAFYVFVRQIEKRQRYYQRKYGLVPTFKTGAHVGKVMVLQVGQIRRDISYNGDTINTTARIESVCNDYNSTFLISGNLFHMITDAKEFKFKQLDNIKLKGKRQGIDIYQVKN